MPQTTYKDHLDNLLPLAEGQEGYFLAGQATEQGVSHLTLSRMVEAGHLERPFRGVYRLVRWPAARHSDLWPLALWAQGKNWPIVFSHRTALQLHNVSDANPSRVDITIPLEARFRGTLPKAVVVHHAAVPPSEIERIDRLPVTNLYRTLLDLMVAGQARDAVGDVLNSGRTLKDLTKQDLKQLQALYTMKPELKRFLARRNRLAHQ